MDVSIINLKKHLNIEQEYTDDDTLLTNLLEVSSLAVSNYLGFTGTTALPSYSTVNAAIILLAANYYSNRNMIAFTGANELPYTFKFLLSPYLFITAN